MSKYLLKTVETYRVDTEEEADALIDEAKKDSVYALEKFSSQYKTRKSKGEVIDDYYKVILTKSFTSDKEPDEQCSITYSNGMF